MIDLRLTDPEYTDRLVSFLTSLGQNAVVAGPDTVELAPGDDAGAQVELGIYLRVWNVLYPDARVDVESQPHP